MNLTYKDLNGALMLICYDTVSTEDECDTMSHCLSYTIEDGVLIRYELNGDDDVDHTIDQGNYEVAQTTVFDLDCFATPNDLLIKILITEGKEIIREAPFNEEVVVDNKVTLKLYDASRNEILSLSRKISAKVPERPVRPETDQTYTPDQLNDLGESLLRLQRSICIEGWRDFGFHAFLLVAAGALAVWVFWDYTERPGMKWVLAAMFGLYFTQLWWSNRRTCPIFVAWPLTRRVEDRPWINGGALSGLGMSILLFCFPEVKLADAFFAGLIIAYCVTSAWWAYSRLNKLIDGPETILAPALKNLQRRSRRAARRSFFVIFPSCR